MFQTVFNQTGSNEVLDYQPGATPNQVLPTPFRNAPTIVRDLHCFSTSLDDVISSGSRIRKASRPMTSKTNHRVWKYKNGTYAGQWQVQPSMRISRRSCSSLCMPPPALQRIVAPRSRVVHRSWFRRGRRSTVSAFTHTSEPSGPRVSLFNWPRPFSRCAQVWELIRRRIQAR